MAVAPASRASAVTAAGGSVLACSTRSVVGAIATSGTRKHPPRAFQRAGARFRRVDAARERDAHAALLVGLGLAEQAQVGARDAQRVGHAFVADAARVEAAV